MSRHPPARSSPGRWPAAWKLCGGIACAVTLSACALFVVDGSFAPTVPYTRSTRSPGEIMLFYRGELPTRSFVRVGTILVTRTEWQNNNDLLNGVRREASRAGLDGVVDLFCGFHSSYAYQCNGTAFVFQP